jgi:hypothetical protein
VKVKDMEGVWLGDRLILGREGTRKHSGNIRWRWQCVCGRTGVDRGDRLRAKGGMKCNHKRKMTDGPAWDFWRDR